MLPDSPLLYPRAARSLVAGTLCCLPEVSGASCCARLLPPACLLSMASSSSVRLMLAGSSILRCSMSCVSSSAVHQECSLLMAAQLQSYTACEAVLRIKLRWPYGTDPCRINEPNLGQNLALCQS